MAEREKPRQPISLGAYRDRKMMTQELFVPHMTDASSLTPYQLSFLAGLNASFGLPPETDRMTLFLYMESMPKDLYDEIVDRINRKGNDEYVVVDPSTVNIPLERAKSSYAQSRPDNIRPFRNVQGNNDELNF